MLKQCPVKIVRSELSQRIVDSPSFLCTRDLFGFVVWTIHCKPISHPCARPGSNGSFAATLDNPLDTAPGFQSLTSQLESLGPLVLTTPPEMSWYRVSGLRVLDVSLGLRLIRNVFGHYIPVFVQRFQRSGRGLSF